MWGQVKLRKFLGRVLLLLLGQAMGGALWLGQARGMSPMCPYLLKLYIDDQYVGLG